MSGHRIDAETERILALLARLDAELVAIGHGRDDASTRAALNFGEVWRDAGHALAGVTDWPAGAASWLRPARRLTAAAPDAWVIADRPESWAPMAARLSEDTAWDPARTFAFSSLGTPRLVELCGTAVEGMAGPTSSGGLWHVHRGRLVANTPRRPHHEDAMPTSLLPRDATEIAPGAIHVPDYLSLAEQRALVAACRAWARGPVPIHRTRLSNGKAMSVQTVCLGWHWAPYHYTRTADDVNGAAVAPFPDWLGDLAREALVAAAGDPHAATSYAPDAALVNFYDADARLGKHQDKEERSDAPVVSLSIGDTCVFRFGNTETRGRPYTDVELRSGDLFVFGGPSRFAYHGVPKIVPASADPACGLASGRLNVTLRVTGLDEPPAGSRR